MSAPTLVSIAAKDHTIAIKYSQALDESVVLDPASFSVHSDNPLGPLTPASAVVFGDTVYLGVAELMLVAIITVSTDTTLIRNLAGEVAADLNNQAASNSSTGVDNTAPNLLSGGIVADEEFVYLYFNEVLSINSVPATSAFALIAANAAQSSIVADLVAITGIRLTLTLDGWIRNSQGLTAAYAVPASNAIKDVAGNAAAAIATTAAVVKTSRLALPKILSVWAADQLAAQMPASEVANYLAASAADRRKWLGFASRDVNNAMRYQGRKWDPLQANEFPRISGNVFINPMGLPLPLPAYPSIGGEVWDWDLENNRAVTPLDVKLAVIRQADSLAGGRGQTLNAQHDGLSAQAAGPISESYVGTAAGSAAPKLCNEAWELLKRFRLRVGDML
jgi:hypothetical protein